MSTTFVSQPTNLRDTRFLNCSLGNGVLTQQWPSAAPVNDFGILRQLGRTLHFGRNQTIFNEGDPADEVFRIVTGTVRLCRHTVNGRRQIVRFIAKGDFFGLSRSGGYTLTAEAVDDVEVSCYPKQLIDKLRDEFPNFRHNMQNFMSKQMMYLQDHLMTVGHWSARVRVATFLAELFDSAGAKEEEPIDILMTQQDISDYLCLTVETVCRILGALKRSGVIKMPSPHKIIVADMDMLRALAEDEESV